MSNNGSTWSADAVFTTAALPAFRFTAFGDEAASPTTAGPMAQLVASLNPAFHLIAGDLAYAWGPLFDLYQVDLVISGHMHAYERTNPMLAGRPTGQVPSGGTVNQPAAGTTYICAGTGGKRPLPDLVRQHRRGRPG